MDRPVACPVAWRARIVALAFGLAVAGAGAGRAEAPIIDHQPVPCSLPGAHPRICATIADDGTVKRAKVYFRVAGEPAYYWSEMTLDFPRFCATLPVPDAKVRTVEYHVWAVDDQLGTKRTADFPMTVDPGASCPNPVIDEDPERTAHLAVYATTGKQGRKLRGFDPAGVEFHRFQD